MGQVLTLWAVKKRLSVPFKNIIISRSNLIKIYNGAELLEKKSLYIRTRVYKKFFSPIFCPCVKMLIKWGFFEKCVFASGVPLKKGD